MHTTIVLFILSMALIAVFDTAGSSRQGTGAKRDLAPTAVSGCEALEGRALEDCIRKARREGVPILARSSRTGA